MIEFAGSLFDVTDKYESEIIIETHKLERILIEEEIEFDNLKGNYAGEN